MRNKMRNKRPNFFIIGAAKSGTTTLYDYLDNHKNIYLSPIKEPNYFSSDIKVDQFSISYRNNTVLDTKSYFSNNDLPELQVTFIRDFEEYKTLFKDVTDELAIGEASTSYLYSGKAAQNIYEFNQGSKIIAILRNPIERAFSHYLMALRYGFTHQNFRKAVESDINKNKKGWGISELFIELGLYYQQLKRYYDIFPHNNIRIYLFEDLVKNPQFVINDCCKFLGVKSVNLHVKKHSNKAQVPKMKFINTFITKTGLKKMILGLISSRQKETLKQIAYSDDVPEISQKDAEFLESIFQDDIKKTSHLIGKDLGHWLLSEKM